MANLNAPFLLLQREQCAFNPLTTASKITAASRIKIAEDTREEDMGSQELTFEPTQENLFVVADTATGCVALCSHESYKGPSKFLVKLQPKVILLPTVTDEKVGCLLSHCFVRCPAPNILSASTMLLCTLHQDNILRLWNTDDGRCISTSTTSMLTSNGINLKTIKGFPGHVLLFGDLADFYVVNVYTMTVVSHMCMNFKGFVKCKYVSATSTLQICDENGAVYEFSDAKQKANEVFRLKDYSESGRPLKLNQSQLLRLTKRSSQLTFKFEQHFAIEGRSMLTVRRLKQCKVLAYMVFPDQSQMLQISQDQIEQTSFQDRTDPNKLFNLSVKLPIKEFRAENILIFAKFLKQGSKVKYLVTVDLNCVLSVWSIDKLLAKYQPTEAELMVMRVTLVEPEFTVNLFQGCTVFDYHKAWIKEGFFTEILSDFATKQDAIDASMQLLRGVLVRSLDSMEAQVRGGQQPSIFKMIADEKTLYTTVHIGSSTFKKEQNLMLSWELDNLLRDGEINSDYKPLLCISNLNLFYSQVATENDSVNCPLSFNDLIVQSYFNKLQFDFFFTDEVVTHQATFFDKDLPALIVGTNYGRICIVPMFQEVEDSVLPITLIDSHGRYPIESLYVVYQYARAIDREKGGHLVSTSSDGTIAITNLGSTALIKTLQDYQQRQKTMIGREKRRIVQTLESRAKNQKQGRRNSVSNHFSTANYYHYVRFSADHVFRQQTSTPVKSIVKIRTIQETVTFLQGAQSSPQKQDTSNKEVFYYACLASDSNEVALLTFNKKAAQITLDKLPMLSEPVNSVYLESQSHNLMLVLRDSLMMQQFNLRTHQLLLRKRLFSATLRMLQVDETLDSLFHSQKAFLTELAPTDLNHADFHNFEKDDHIVKQNILNGNGLHPVLDYMNLGLTTPVQYQPQSSLTGENSQPFRDFMQNKPKLLAYSAPLSLKPTKQQERDKQEVQEHVFRTIAKVVHSDEAYSSDLNQRLYKQISGITAVHSTGQQILGSNQHILVASTQDVFDAIQRKLLRHQQNAKQEESKEVKREDLSQNKWPAKMLSCLHPFNLDDVLDESLEQYFNLNLPFLDFRLGIQGVANTFSFIISKEDQNYHSERDHIVKIINLFKLSRRIREHQQQASKFKISMSDVLPTYVDPLDATLFLGRFFNSENWKASSHMSTMIPTFFLSQLVALIDFDELKMQEFGQEWLSVLQLISTSAQFRQSAASPLSETKDISLTTVSELLLKNDLNISSCAKDIICKPFLCNQNDLSHRKLAETIEDWKALVLDVYEQIKHDSKHEPTQPQQRPNDSHQWERQDGQRYMTMAGPGQFGGGLKEPEQRIANMPVNQSSTSIDTRVQLDTDKKSLFSYFGQNEIRGLIALSFYAFYCQSDQFNSLDKQMLERVSKLVIILIKEVVQRFQGNKNYINLLTTLLYLLQCNLKTASANFKNDKIIEDVVTLLLFIFNFYKPALNREQFITRVTAQNFHLIRPTNPELYLKFSGAKALLEIGVSYTDKFLELIQQHAVTLVKGVEHQKNVLETLRYFINGYGDNLERYLVQIVHILLQCLDPNELALRKNSHKYVSVILSTMVKIFPMVAFHHETQRLAVGTHEGPIGIYDVRTSAKWKVLEGHTSNVTCLSFDSKGNYLASYSANDMTLKLWKVGNTGFFSTLISGAGKQSKEVKLKPLASNVPNPHVHLNQESKQTALDSRAVSLLPRDDSEKVAQTSSQVKDSGQRINKCRIAFLPPAEKDVELIREDGSRSVHDLVR